MEPMKQICVCDVCVCIVRIVLCVQVRALVNVCIHLVWSRVFDSDSYVHGHAV